MTRKSFSLNAAMTKALQIILDDNAAHLAEGDKGYRDQFTYLTGTDLEWQVRRLAEASAAGESWETVKRNGCYGHSSVRISTGGAGSLLDVCRDFLRHHSLLESFNFGRGHISGARYRLRGTGLNETEQKTMKAKAERKPYKERITHYARREYGNALCTAVQRAERHGGYFGGRSKSMPKTTTTRSEVTCKACLSLLEGRECFNVKHVYLDDAGSKSEYRVRRYTSVEALLDGKPEAAPVAVYKVAKDGKQPWELAREHAEALRKAARQ